MAFCALCVLKHYFGTCRGRSTPPQPALHTINIYTRIPAILLACRSENVAYRYIHAVPTCCDTYNMLAPCVCCKHYLGQVPEDPHCPSKTCAFLHFNLHIVYRYCCCTPYGVIIYCAGIDIQYARYLWLKSCDGCLITVG